MTSPAFSTAFAKEAFNVEAVPQVWVIEPGLGAAWTLESFGPGAWATEPPSGISWTRQTFVPTLTSVRRITEDGRLRITEQRMIRIVSRAYVDPWIKTAPPGAAWRVSHA